MASARRDSNRDDTPPTGGGASSPPRSPTTAAERWSEIVENSHEGLAVLDVDGRFVFVSDRTAAMLGSRGEELLGRELDHALPELTAGDHAMIRTALETGEPVRLMCTRRGDDGWIRALRMTVVPRPNPSDGMIMLAHDITSLRVVQDQQRRAQHRLTAVEDEERHRIRWKIHDGPVQVLAALALRLGLTVSDALDPADLSELELAIDSAGRELRVILDEPLADLDGTPEDLFMRWAAPLIDGSGLGLEVDDVTTEPPNMATTEALFVFVHETIKAALVVDPARTIGILLADKADGYEMTVSVPHRLEPPPDQEDERHHIGLGGRYAALLGGFLQHHVDDDGTYRLTAVIPQLDERGWAATALTDAGVEPLPDGAQEPLVGRVGFDMLSDADREATARASFQGLMELDAELRVTHVNDSYAATFQQPVGEILGRRFEDLFRPADYERLRPYVEQVRRGSRARFEWRRRNHAGEPQWTQVAASPRLDGAGRFEGALVMTADTTNLHIAEDLRDAVQVELEQAKRGARRRTAQRLDGPIRQLDGVNERLIRMMAATDPGDVIRVIQQQLEKSILDLRSAIDQLADPDLTDKSWRDALSRSLTAQFRADQVDLVIHQQTAQPPAGGQGEVLRRVARNIVTDAVRRRRARRVEVRLTGLGPDYLLRIVDDGRARTHGLPTDEATRPLTDFVALHGGTVDVDAGGPAGEVVTVTIPRADDRLVPL